MAPLGPAPSESLQAPAAQKNPSVPRPGPQSAQPHGLTWRGLILFTFPRVDDTARPGTAGWTVPSVSDLKLPLIRSKRGLWNGLVLDAKKTNTMIFFGARQTLGTLTSDRKLSAFDLPCSTSRRGF